jgi:hypothetical protein
VKKGTIRASEIGGFLYCRRAWWYAAQGTESANQEQLELGERYHRQHGRAVLKAGCLRLVGYVLLLGALVSWAIYLTSGLLG